MDLGSGSSGSSFGANSEAHGLHPRQRSRHQIYPLLPQKSADPEGVIRRVRFSLPLLLSSPQGLQNCPFRGGEGPCREPSQAPKRDSKTHIPGMVTFPASLGGFGSPHGLQKGSPFEVPLGTFAKTSKPCFLRPLMQFGQVGGVKGGPLWTTAGRLVLRCLWGTHLDLPWGAFDPKRAPPNWPHFLVVGLKNGFGP